MVEIKKQNARDATVANGASANKINSLASLASFATLALKKTYLADAPSDSRTPSNWPAEPSIWFLWQMKSA